MDGYGEHGETTTQTDPWTFREQVLAPDEGRDEDLDGFDVWANDGDIGKVDEHAVVPGASYVVVDTASWAFGSKRVVPAAVIDEIDYDERRVHLRMCKAQVRSAPDPGESRSGDWYRVAVRDYFDRYVS